MKLLSLARAVRMAPGSLVVGDGGLIGYAVGELLWQSMDRVGTLVIIAASFFVGLLFTTEGWVLKIPSAMSHAAQASGSTSLLARMFRRLIPIPQTASEGVSTEESEELLPARRSIFDLFKSKKKISSTTEDDDEYEYVYEDEDDEQRRPRDN